MEEINIISIFFLEVQIDEEGKALDIQVNSNETVLTSLADSLCGIMRDFIAQQQFHIDQHPYKLEKWVYEDRFYATRNPVTIAKQDLIAYNKNVCTLDSLRGVYIPFDLKDAHQSLDQLLGDSTKAQIKRGDPSHFGAGLWMRNNWGLWSGGRLQCYFNQKNLYHPDHISSFILLTYQLNLNQQIINQDSLLLEYSKAEQKWSKQ